MNNLALITNLLRGDGLIIVLVVVLLFGAKRIPELARGLGSAVREFSKAKDEVENGSESSTTPPKSHLP